jgi:DNA (cytosine-5)-methyltransferase 1
MFLVAGTGDGFDPRPLLFEPEGVPGYSPARREAQSDIAGTLGGGSGVRGWCDDLDRSGAFIVEGSRLAYGRNNTSGPIDTSGTLTSSKSHRFDFEPDTFVLEPPVTHVTGDVTHTLTAEGFDASEDGTGRGTPIINQPMPFDLAQVTSANNRTKCAPGDLAPTLARTSRVHVAWGPPGRVRRLTPRECERLQGFPDGWTCLCGVAPYSTAACTCPDGPRLRALGNAVAVPCVNWIAHRFAVYT